MIMLIVNYRNMLIIQSHQNTSHVIKFMVCGFEQRKQKLRQIKINKKL